MIDGYFLSTARERVSKDNKSVEDFSDETVISREPRRKTSDRHPKFVHPDGHIRMSYACNQSPGDNDVGPALGIPCKYRLLREKQKAWLQKTGTSEGREQISMHSADSHCGSCDTLGNRDVRQTSNRRLMHSAPVGRRHRLRTTLSANQCEIVKTNGAESENITCEDNESERRDQNKIDERRENQTRIPQWAFTLLSKPPDDRTELDCRKIHALLRGLQSFDKFTERIQMAMCKAFSYDWFVGYSDVDSTRVVLRTGHVGVKFYFIYSGSVFVNVEDLTKDGKSFIKTKVILIRGDSFGELALLQDTRRNATVTVREQCELLTVDKRVFSHICPSIFDQELKEKVAFIRKMPLFSHKDWGLLKLTALCSQAQMKEYKTNKIVTLDSFADEWIYICMQGKCRVIRHMRVASSDIVDGQPTDPRRNSCYSNVVCKRYQPQELPKDATQGNREKIKEKEFERTKSRLLESMNLEYLPHTTVNSMISAVGREYEDDIETAKKSQIKKSVTTLTSLMTDQSLKAEYRDYVYIEFASLQPGHVLDLYGIMEYHRNLRSGRCTTRDGSVVLVSAGAKVVRFKKSMFFKMVTHESFNHAIDVVQPLRFPSDSVLLQSLNEKILWDHYRMCTSNHAVREISARKCVSYARRRASTRNFNHHRLLQTTNITPPASKLRGAQRTWLYDLTLTTLPLVAPAGISVQINRNPKRAMADDEKVAEEKNNHEIDRYAFMPTLWLE